MVTIKKIRELRKTLEVTKNEPLKSKVLASLVGRLSEAEQIHPAYKKIREVVLAEHSSAWSKVVAYRQTKAGMMRRRTRL
jgi:predicted transcriptional regulator